MEAEHLIISMCSWHPVKTPRWVRHQLQVDERGLDRGVSQPAAQVVDLDSVHQQVASVAVPQGVRAYPAPGHDRPSSSALLTAALTQRHAVDGWISTSFTWLMLQNDRADRNATCSSRSIGTILDLLPLPARTLSVGIE